MEGRDREEGFEHANQDEESSGLRGNGQISGHGSGSALIDIGGPELEGHGSDFEPEGHQHHRQAKKDARMVGDRNLGQGHFDGGEIGLPGRSVEPSNSVNKEAGRKGPEDQVFRSRLEVCHAATHVGDLDVERNRHQLERAENHDEVRGGRHPEESRAGEDGEDEKFSRSRSGALGGDKSLDDRQVIHRHHENENRREDQKAFEEKREPIHDIETGFLECSGVRIQKEGRHEHGR